MDISLPTAQRRYRVDSSQARASSRIRIQVPVFLRASDSTGSEFIELTKTLNISCPGACIASTHILRLGQTVHLTIPAPSPSSSSLVPSETPPITAKVRRRSFWGKCGYSGWNSFALLSNPYPPTCNLVEARHRPLLERPARLHASSTLAYLPNL